MTTNYLLKCSSLISISFLQGKGQDLYHDIHSQATSMRRFLLISPASSLHIHYYLGLCGQQRWMACSSLHTLVPCFYWCCFPVLGLLFHCSHLWTSIYPLRPPTWYSLGSLLPLWVLQAPTLPWVFFHHCTHYLVFIHKLALSAYVSLSSSRLWVFCEVVEGVLFIFLYQCLAESNYK